MSIPRENRQDTVSRQKPVAFQGTCWFRVVFRTRRKSILSTDGAFLYGGRYNPAEVFGALYLSESSEGCLAELRRRPAAPRDCLIGRIRINVGRVFDLTDPDVLEQLGIDRDDLCGDEWELTQELGECIREAGFEGVLVPSAAGPYRNLVLFPDRFSGDSTIVLQDIRPLPTAEQN
jgi:RES domain-containing protein